MKKYKVLFCDLDGTLIETISGETFPKGIWDMKIKFEVLDAIEKMSPEYVFIVSNQGGVEKGFVSYFGMMNKVQYVCSCVKDYCEIKRNVEGVFCSSNDSTHKDRKPNVGMLERFYHDYYGNNDFDKKDALMIGDASGNEGQWSDTDKKTAENFGIDYLDVNDFVEQYK